MNGGKNDLSSKVIIYGDLILIISAGLIAVLFFLIDLLSPNSDIQIFFYFIIIAIFNALVGVKLIIDSEKHRQKKLEQKGESQASKNRVLTIINSLSDAMLEIDQTGKIELFNASAINLLNTNQSLIGQNVSDLLVLQNLEGTTFNLTDELKKIKTNTERDDLILVVEGEILRIRLNILPIRKTFSPENSAEKQNFAIFMRDVTKQKTLDDEREEFISVVSHELRTPVAIAEGAISNLQVMLSKNMPLKQIQASADLTYQQINFLASMINDLSTLSRAERGVGAHIEVIDTEKLAHDLFLKYQKQTEEKGLALNLDIANNLHKVETSRLYLEEILQNLIVNAIKYTKEGSVTISIKNSKNSVCFAIKDTGIGISKKEQGKIFGKFYRSEDYRTRETGGTGLGLYVSEKLAQKINTKIQIASRLNFGSTFYFSLPKVKKN